MIFNFNLLGILITFVLIVIYYSKKINDNEKKTFRGILIVNYLIELTYLCIYILINNGSNISELFSKIYLMFLIIYTSLIIGYLTINTISEKYKLDNIKLKEKIKILKNIITIIDIVAVIILFILPINFNDNILNGNSVYFTYTTIFIYSLGGFFILFANYEHISYNLFKKLFILDLINITGAIIQYYFCDINIIGVCYEMITLILFLTLENNNSSNVELLKLENEAMKRSSIDTNKFLTNMSYEIRTPLNAIDGLSQVIEDSNDIDSIKEDVKDIRTASKNLVDIINGIIDIATIENGKMEIISENYDSYTMFDNICNIAKSRLKKSNVELKIDIAKNIPPTLNGDEERIEQILLNILTNSIKYTKEGFILLKVDAVNSNSLCRLKITISDTGIGMKKEELDKLFERTSNPNDDNKNKLGLIIVKKLTELMNGKIDVQSNYGKGTTFTITIDQKVVNILEDKEDTSEKNKKKISLFDANEKRILIVDDNKLNLKVATKLLTPYNVQVIEAMSGQECLDLLENDNNFDLILMDDMMPNMSGTETLDVILKLERIDGYHIPIVVLTANAVSGMREKYLKKGFDDYLAKPIDKYELNRVLKKYLKNNPK